MTSGRARTTRPPSVNACGSERRPTRTSETSRDAMSTAMAPVPRTSPSLRWAEASCPQASAHAASQASRPAQVFDRRSRDVAARSRAVHANIPANGRDTTNSDPLTGRARARPPTVAAGREAPSLRRNP